MSEKTGRSKTVDTAIIVAVIGLIGTVVAAFLGSPLLAKLIEPTPAPTLTPVPGTTLVFTQDFESGNTSGFAFESGDWKLSKDKSNHVLEGTGSGSATPSAVASFGPADFTSGVIEFRFKFVQLHGLNLDFRYQDSGSYALYLDPDQQNIVMGKNSSPANNIQISPFSSGSTQAFTFQSGNWYTARLEVSATQFALSLDGNHIMSASDTSLQQGHLRFSLAPGTVINLDDVKVWSFTQ